MAKTKDSAKTSQPIRRQSWDFKVKAKSERGIKWYEYTRMHTHTHTLTHLESKPESRRGGNCLPFLTKTWGNYEIHTGRQFSSTSNSLAAAPNKATVKIVNKLLYSSCKNKCEKYLIRSAS